MSSTHSAAARRFRAKGPILHTAMDRDHLSTDHLSTNEVWLLQKPIYGDRETTKKRPSSPSSRFGSRRVYLSAWDSVCQLPDRLTPERGRSRRFAVIVAVCHGQRRMRAGGISNCTTTHEWRYSTAITEGFPSRIPRICSGVCA